MTVTAETDAKNPAAALERYLAELRADYLSWYQTATNRHTWFWGIGQGVAIFLPLLAAALAALISQNDFHGVPRALIVILSLAGSFAASLVAQTKARELLSLRERGRERIQALISKPKQVLPPRTVTWPS